jgi:hypothetical protein
MFDNCAVHRSRPLRGDQFGANHVSSEDKVIEQGKFVADSTAMKASKVTEHQRRNSGEIKMSEEVTRKRFSNRGFEHPKVTSGSPGSLGSGSTAPSKTKSKKSASKKHPPTDGGNHGTGIK